jgi:hypothetical protein
MREEGVLEAGIPKEARLVVLWFPNEVSQVLALSGRSLRLLKRKKKGGRRIKQEKQKTVLREYFALLNGVRRLLKYPNDPFFLNILPVPSRAVPPSY